MQKSKLGFDFNLFLLRIITNKTAITNKITRGALWGGFLSLVGLAVAIGFGRIDILQFLVGCGLMGFNFVFIWNFTEPAIDGLSRFIKVSPDVLDPSFTDASGKQVTILPRFYYAPFVSIRNVFNSTPRWYSPKFLTEMDARFRPLAVFADRFDVIGSLIRNLKQHKMPYELIFLMFKEFMPIDYFKKLALEGGVNDHNRRLSEFSYYATDVYRNHHSQRLLDGAVENVTTLEGESSQYTETIKPRAIEFIYNQYLLSKLADRHPMLGRVAEYSKDPFSVPGVMPGAPSILGVPPAEASNQDYAVAYNPEPDLEAQNAPARGTRARITSVTL